MKTIKELYDTNVLSARARNVIFRNIGKYFKAEMVKNPDFEYCVNGLWFVDYDEEPEFQVGRDLTEEEINNLTVKDIFDIFGEKELLSWKGLGKGVVEELKGLL